MGGGKGKGGTVNIDASGGMGRQLNDDYYAHTDASKAFQQVCARRVAPLHPLRLAPQAAAWPTTTKAGSCVRSPRCVSEHLPPRAGV